MHASAGPKACGLVATLAALTSTALAQQTRSTWQQEAQISNPVEACSYYDFPALNDIVSFGARSFPAHSPLQPQPVPVLTFFQRRSLPVFGSSRALTRHHLHHLQRPEYPTIWEIADLSGA